MQKQKFNTRPWEVSLEAYKSLETEIKPNDELIKTAMRLSKRLNYKYGHVAAYLYLEWKERLGEKKVKTWWAKYDKFILNSATPKDE